MGKTSFQVLALGLALFAGVTEAATLQSPVGAAVIDTGRRGAQAAVLWSQMTGDTGVGLASQNFEAALDTYDSQGIDDFVVPEGEVWLVEVVEAEGTHFGGLGPARSENVVFYSHADGAPDGVIRAYMELVGDRPRWGSYVITLPEPLKLKPGRYWVSVQANIDWLTTSELWGWETSSTRQGRRAMWKNPLNGFGTGCTDYRRLRDCFVDLGHATDYMFVLYGKRKSTP